jgi:hypothetical protein
MVIMQHLDICIQLAVIRAGGRFIQLSEDFSWNSGSGIPPPSMKRSCPVM